MKGPLACLIAATLCLGCQAPPGAIDPFIGRQTVPPPGTGTPSAMPPGDAYYSGAPKTSAATSASPNGTPYDPPGGSYRYGNNNLGSQATRPGASISNGSSASGGGSSLTTPASRETTPVKPGTGGSPVRSASPTESPPGTGAGRSTPGAGFQVNSNQNRAQQQATVVSSRSAAQPAGSRQPTPAQPAKDITDLPDARPTTKAPPSRDGFRPPGSATRSSYEEDVPEARDSSKASRTPRRESLAPGKYEADRSYRWLKGKLEYSKIDDRWKLRYIPIDGETDDFGGSVVLSGSRLLDGYKAGEYVTVYGTLADTDARSAGFAPSYTVDRVVRQAEE